MAMAEQHQQPLNNLAQQINPSVATVAVNQQFSGNSPTWTNASRSEHAVSNPIMVQARGPQYGAIMVSPRSISDQSGIFHQIVENVLSSSPQSLNTRDKFGSAKIDKGAGKAGVAPGIGSLEHKNGTNNTTPANDPKDAPIVVNSRVSQPVPVPISYHGDITMMGTPEFSQYPFMLPGQAGTPVIYTAGGGALFSSTPTNYGYGSWGAVYPPPQHQAAPNGTTADPIGHIHGTPPTSVTATAAAIYSTSPPGTLFPIGPPFHQSGGPPPPPGALPPHQITGLASTLQQMAITANQQTGTRRDSFNTSSTNYTAIPTQGQSFYMMTPPNASGFAAFAQPHGQPPLHLQTNSNAPPPNIVGPAATNGGRTSLLYRPQGLPMGGGYGATAANALQHHHNGAIVHPGPRGMISSVMSPPQRLHSHHPEGDRAIAGHRSQLLDDYRNNRAVNLQLTDLGKHVVEFAQDQHGSRFIQQKLERATNREKQIIFDEVVQHASSLMTDVFGNYVIQKFFEYGTEEQKMQLMQALRGSVMTLALQMYGCRVIQKALESVDRAGQMEIIAELSPQVLKCVKDQNGNHVVQKIIERVEPEQLQFIIEAMTRGVPETVCSLSTHPYGCRVIQRVLEHCTEEQKRPVLEQLHENILTLVTDQYGNYVIQHVIEHGLLEDKERIVSRLRGDVLKYAQHKFASNVIEKCLICGSMDQKNSLIDEVCVDNGTPNPPLLEMMKDPFANYVVQKMLDVADSTHRKKMMFAIKGHIPALRKFNYGKHIITKLEKYFQKANPSMAPLFGVASSHTAQQAQQPFPPMTTSPIPQSDHFGVVNEPPIY